MGNIDKYEVVSTLAQIFLFRFTSACLKEPISGPIISPRILLFTRATALWRYCAYGRHHISWTRVFSRCKHRLMTVPQNRRLQNILGDADLSCYQIKVIEFTQYPKLQQKFNFTRAPFKKKILAMLPVLIAGGTVPIILHTMSLVISVLAGRCGISYWVCVTLNCRNLKNNVFNCTDVYCFYWLCIGA